MHKVYGNYDTNLSSRRLLNCEVFAILSLLQSMYPKYSFPRTPRAYWGTKFLDFVWDTFCSVAGGLPAHVVGYRSIFVSRFSTLLLL